MQRVVERPGQRAVSRVAVKGGILGKRTGLDKHRQIACIKALVAEADTGRLCKGADGLAHAGKRSDGLVKGTRADNLLFYCRRIFQRQAELTAQLCTNTRYHHGKTPS